jgi:hypothetical protein
MQNNPRVPPSQFPAPPHVVEGFNIWFEKEFGTVLAVLGNLLERPMQNDGNSCSICTMSTISHGLFGDCLWNQPDADIHRVKWFIDLVNEFEEPSPVS